MALRKSSVLITILLINVVFFSCRETFVQPVKDNLVNLLVIEGLINTGGDSTIFTLSRTFKLNNNAVVSPEKAAVVQVESDAGNVYVLPETMKSGKYGALLSFDPQKKYRLRVRTKNNNQYLSEFVEAKASPPFEISYDFNNNALNFRVDTHDPSGKSIYYLHSYEETWEYESHLTSLYKIENGAVVIRNFPEDNIRVCWRTLPSSNIMLTSTNNLSEDRITKKQILSIPGSSSKLHIEYSVLFKQTALSKEAFAFWETLRNNTEKVGSIFDVQASQLFGNIRSITDPNETVIGFVSAGTVTSKRVTLHVSEFPSSWFNVEDKSDCLESVYDIKLLRSAGLPFIPIGQNTGTDKFHCADCRALGGSLQRPSYWK